MLQKGRCCNESNRAHVPGMSEKKCHSSSGKRYRPDVSKHVCNNRNCCVFACRDCFPSTYVLQLVLFFFVFSRTVGKQQKYVLLLRAVAKRAKNTYLLPTPKNVCSLFLPNFAHFWSRELSIVYTKNRKQKETYVCRSPRCCTVCRSTSCPRT